MTKSSTTTLPQHHNDVSCTYPFWSKVGVWVLTLPFILIGVLMAFRAISILLVMVQGLASSTTLEMQRGIEVIVPVAGMALIMLLFPTLMLSMYSDLYLSEEGIRVQVIGLWWICVPWEDVLDIKPTVVASFWGHRRSQLVFVRKLTFLHWLLGWVFGLKLKPAFNIKATQEGYDDAIRMTKGKLGKV